MCTHVDLENIPTQQITTVMTTVRAAATSSPHDCVYTHGQGKELRCKVIPYFNVLAFLKPVSLTSTHPSLYSSNRT